ncbi:hypothetical protein BDP55DRAFT_313158 [Colletotrichum godetiae]|uniref:Uncharacterized protein n=1 Tax=Colletotrichum godetiae TaxID=1209918 RepID=A0AAJ0EYE0_9PEZI|nr:uncharacterized protein BDP55DRAFT_313158 [Colletotrichum godetiae]KAK1690925.1 hypothetical protein BDP55DRAFT_313158 [Colletotrichum godetiae]
MATPEGAQGIHPYKRAAFQNPETFRCFRPAVCEHPRRLTLGSLPNGARIFASFFFRPHLRVFSSLAGKGNGRDGVSVASRAKGHCGGSAHLRRLGKES